MDEKSLTVSRYAAASASARRSSCERGLSPWPNLAQSRLPCELMRGSPNTRSYEESAMSRRTLVFSSPILLYLAAGSALAQSRPQSVGMTCRAAAALVFQRGAIVLGTGGYTYEIRARPQLLRDHRIDETGLCADARQPPVLRRLHLLRTEREARQT